MGMMKQQRRKNTCIKKIEGDVVDKGEEYL